MQQNVQCSNCQTAFQTPGVLQGKTSAVVCPKCKRVVVVQGEMDPNAVGPGPASKSGISQDGSTAWKVRSEYDRPVVERKPEPEPKPEPVQIEKPPLWKVGGAALFMVSCVTFMFFNIFRGSAPDPEIRMKMEAAREAFTTARVAKEGDVEVAYVGIAGAEALKDMDPRQICMNAMFGGLQAKVIKTESGVTLADCAGGIAPPQPATP